MRCSWPVSTSGRVTANAPGTWALVAGALPPGLLLDGATGVISGTPAAAGTFTFTLAFTDTAVPPRTVERQFVIHVANPLAILNVAPPFGVQDAPYSFRLDATGGVGSLTWSVIAGSLPTGLTLEPTSGVVSGTPTVGGVFGFSVMAQDHGHPRNTATQAFTITVQASGPTDLRLSLVPSADPIAAGSTLTYTLGVVNPGPLAAVGVTATQTLPSGVTFLSADAPCVRAGSLVTCEIGALGPSQASSLAIRVRPEVGGVTLISVAEVVSSSGETAPGDNAATVSTVVTGAGSRRVWVANAGTTDAISFIDPDTQLLVGTLTLADVAQDVAFSPDGQFAYVAHYLSDSVSVISTATAGVVAILPVTRPLNLAVTPDGSRIYVVASDSVSVFDAVTHASVATIAMGGSSPLGLAISPDARRVYVACRSSESIAVIDSATNTVVATIPVGSDTYPVDVAVSPGGKRLYVANYFGGTVSVIDTKTNGIVSNIPVGLGPEGVAVSPDGRRVYVANFNDGTVSVIDAATNVVIASPPVGGGPNGIVVSPDGAWVYVTAYNASAVHILSTATNTVVGTVGTGSLPIAVDYVRLRP